MAFKRSPFAGLNNIPATQTQNEPPPLPKNIQRDSSKPHDSNMVSWERAKVIASIDSLSTFDSQKSKGQSWFKAKMTLLYTDSEAQKAGDKVAFLLDMGGQYFDKDCSAFICNVMNLPPSAFAADGSDHETMCGPGQPVTQRRRCVMIEVDNKKGKDGRDWPKLFWSPIEVPVNADGTFDVSRATIPPNKTKD